MEDRVCLAEDCDRLDIKARGLCGRCYSRAQRGIIPVPPLIRADYPDRPLGKKEVRKCQHCDEPFLARPHEPAKFCSKSCYDESRKTSIARSCLICGTPIEVIPSRVIRSDESGKYCSYACRGVASRSNETATCNVPGCHVVGSPGRQAAEDRGIVELIRGMCPKHYTRWRAHGDPTIVLPVGQHSNQRRGKDHPAWNGNDIGYSAAHGRAKSLWGSASSYPCVECGRQAIDWAYDGTDPSERRGRTPSGSLCAYSPYPEFYMPMCRKCHIGRDVALRRGSISNNPKGVLK